MRRLRYVLAACLLGAGVLVSGGSASEAAGQTASRSVVAHNPAEYETAIRNARAGDTIVLANGVWRDFEIVFEGRGRAGAPITLAAETPGRVILSGRSSLRLAGEHLLVRGLTFRDGHSPSGEVIAFRRDSRRLAFHSRVTEIVIDGFNKPNRGESDIWVALFGRHNRLDHSHIEGKLTAGVTIAVRLDAPDSTRNHHRIDHNYFGPRPPLGSNGGETLRIGTSAESLEDSNTIVEYNFFEECSGEIEIVSNKSGANIFRGNVFLRSQGSLTLRHGNGNLVEGNFFLGGGAPNTGGVRVINANQTVRNNVFVGLRGERFAGALVVMNGVPNSPINRYHQVRNALIENNAFIDVRSIEFGAGADAERSLAPTESAFRNNLIVGGPSDLFKTRSDLSGIAFDGNIVSGEAAAPASPGFERRTIAIPAAPADALVLALDAPELARITRGLLIVSRDEVGTSWYPKPAGARARQEGRRIEVRPGIDTLSAAVERAAPGDVIELSAGEYLQRRTIDIVAPVTLRAEAPRRASIAFEPSTLFALSGRGSLRLEGLRITGRAAPDAVGNSVIRAHAPHPPHNYTIEIVESEFVDLNVNRGFAVLRADRFSFADRIRIEKSRFENLSGPVLSLHGETEAFGVYNAEEILVADSEFRRIAAPAFDIHRAGKDESTFGPHFIMRDSVFSDVGAARAPSALLHGVQVVELSGNRFENSGRVRVVIDVGEPRIIVDGESESGRALEIADNRS